MVTWQEFFSLVALVCLFVIMFGMMHLAWGWL
jgi:hypothetical protein